MANTDRRTSTRYEDHTGLLHMMTKKAMAVVCQTPIKDSYEYEDLFQQMCVYFVKSAETFKPESGFSFSAYFTRSCWNNFLKWMKVEVRNTTAVGTTSIEAMTSDEEGCSLYEIYADPNSESPEESLERRTEVPYQLERLSVHSRLVVRELLSPSVELLEAVEAHNSAIVAGEKNGRRVEAPTIRMIANHLHLNQYQLSAVKEQLRSSFNVAI